MDKAVNDLAQSLFDLDRCRDTVRTARAYLRDNQVSTVQTVTNSEDQSIHGSKEGSEPAMRVWDGGLPGSLQNQTVIHRAEDMCFGSIWDTIETSSALCNVYHTYCILPCPSASQAKPTLNGLDWLCYSMDDRVTVIWTSQAEWVPDISNRYLLQSASLIPARS